MYRDITERFIDRSKKQQHNIRVGDKFRVPFQTKQDDKTMKTQYKKGTVAGVYKHFAVLVFQKRGNVIRECFRYDEMAKMKRWE